MRGHAVLILVALVAGCRHTKQASAPEGGPVREPPPGAEGIPPRAGRPPVPATPEALIGPEDVKEVQRALAARGLLRGPASGRLDDATTAALQRFQRQEGLAATGFPDRGTVRRLGIDPEQAYRRGRRGTESGSASGSGSGSGAGGGR